MRLCLILLITTLAQRAIYWSNEIIWIAGRSNIYWLHSSHSWLSTVSFTYMRTGSPLIIYFSKLDTPRVHIFLPLALNFSFLTTPILDVPALTLWYFCFKQATQIIAHIMHESLLPKWFQYSTFPFLYLSPNGSNVISRLHTNLSCSPTPDHLSPNLSIELTHDKISDRPNVCHQFPPKTRTHCSWVLVKQN